MVAVPDIDQVEGFKQSQSTSHNRTAAFPNENIAAQTAPTKTSPVIIWMGFLLIISIAAGTYALYQQNMTMQDQLRISEQRIAELEHTLSATGEEMGLSAGAMQVKLTTLTERTDELWAQMDKLWASAWRRNQNEIKKLNEETTRINQEQKKQQADTATPLRTLTQNHTDLTLNLSLLQEQLQSADNLKQQLARINKDVDQLKSKSQSRDAKQLEIGASMAQLEMTQNALIEQLERLEGKQPSSTQLEP